jgi:hypothetical protein
MVPNPNGSNTGISRTADVRVPVIADIDGLGAVYAKSFQRRQKDLALIGFVFSLPPTIKISINNCLY